MLYKQMQKAEAHLPTTFSDENKHNITFFHSENTLLFALFTLMLYFTVFWLTYFLHITLNIAYYKYEVLKYLSHEYLLRIKAYTISYPI